MAIETRLTFDDVKVKAALERVRLALPIGGNMTPVMGSLGRVLKTGAQQRFREQKTPEGTPWKPSQRVLSEGGQTLRLTGRLRNSLTYKADHASVEVGTNVLYARIHQLGGIAGRKTFSGVGPPNRSRLPARPYLGASEADKLELLDTLSDYLGKAWRG